jgi:hypothetical protein
MMVTALSPIIGYDKAAAISYYAIDHDLALKPAALANGVSEELFDKVVDPLALTRPGSADVPELSPFVVAAAAENDRVLGCNEIGAAGIRFVVPSGDKPVGSLSHSIERQEVACDDLARGLAGLLLDGVGVGLERHGGLLRRMSGGAAAHPYVGGGRCISTPMPRNSSRAFRSA